MKAREIGIQSGTKVMGTGKLQPGAKKLLIPVEAGRDKFCQLVE
jgi:hypothetical protein